MIKSRFGIFSFFLIAQSSISNPVKIQNQKIEFFAQGRPSFLKVHGVTEQFSEELQKKNDKLNGSIKLDLTTFKTGIR